MKQKDNAKHKKLIWLLIYFVIFILLILPVQYLNQTGFCYGEMRYLNEQELLDRHLFGKDADKMTMHAKLSILEERNKDPRRSYKLINYPDCCHVSKNHMSTTPSDRFWQNFFGSYIYSLNIYLQRKKEDIASYDDNSPYYQTIYELHTCGISSDEVGGITISKKEYESAIQSNHKHWEEELR